MSCRTRSGIHGLRVGARNDNRLFCLKPLSLKRSQLSTLEQARACHCVATHARLARPPAARRCRLAQKWPGRCCPPARAHLCAGAWPARWPAGRGFRRQSPRKTTRHVAHAATAPAWPECQGSLQSAAQAAGPSRLFLIFCSAACSGRQSATAAVDIKTVADCA